MITRDFIEDSINKTCLLLYKENKEWFVVGINERTVVSEVASRLKLIFLPLGFHVHVEYNREGKERVSKTDLAGNKVLPDIIIHQEGSSEKNLVVIEAKGHWNHTPRKKDKEKLKRLKKKHGYLYLYRLEFGKEQHNLVFIK